MNTAILPDEKSLFVRVDPGEELITSIREACVTHEVQVAVVVSGVGMVSSATLGFFEAEDDRYMESTFDGIHDLSLVCGNVAPRDGEPWPHIHVAFNDRQHHTISGHLMSAVAHITIEVFLTFDELAIRREKLTGLPATRLLCPGE